MDYRSGIGVAAIIKDAVEGCVKKGLIRTGELPPILLERARRDEFGDYATNIAMLIAAREGIPPRRVAEAIVEEVDKGDLIEKMEIAGPGFINIFMERRYWMMLLKESVLKGKDYGRIDIGTGRKVLLEFVSANPTGPLHIGHGRGAAFGDSMANVLEAAGFSVTREFYINDAGSQVKNLAESILLKIREERGEKVTWDKNHYKGEYISNLAVAAAEMEEKEADAIGNYALEEILTWIRKDLSDFNVTFDSWFSESQLYREGAVRGLVNELRREGYIEEREGALWFKSTSFGDDKDRVVVREDGEPTYFASDIAYHHDKFKRGFALLVNVWGADHHGYIPRVKAAMKALGHDDRKLKVILVQMVTILRGGRPVTMSKRAGEYITLRDVLNEVGSDATRFFFMMRKSDAQMDFDLELAKKEAPENPVFYVQYAHARICSIIEHAMEKGIKLSNISEPDLERLELKEEIDLIKHIASFPEVLRGAATCLEPHRVTFYLQELAGKFHPYYNRNRVVSDDIRLAEARLYLCSSVKNIIKNGLGLLGVSAPEKM